MDFFPFGDSKIKIVLTESEAKEYSLEAPFSGAASAGQRRAVFEILELARANVCFDVSTDKILIQLFPVGGGCELFITKLGTRQERLVKMLGESKNVSLLEKNKSFYSFDGLDSLIALAKEIKRRWDGKAPSSDVYYMLGKYYLSIDEYGNGGEPVEFPYIREFARAVTADFSVYLSEHAIEVAKGDGIELFSSL